MHSLKFEGINGSELNNLQTNTHLPDLLNGTVNSNNSNNNLNGDIDPKQLLKNFAAMGNSHLYMNGEWNDFSLQSIDSKTKCLFIFQVITL